MDRHILGTFNNEEEAVSQVEKLLNEEGYSSNELMLVMDSNNEYDKKKESIKNVTVNKVEVEEESIWEKVKEAFSFGSYDSEGSSNTLEEYGVPHDRAEHYIEALKAGEIVLLADSDAPKNNGLSEVNEEVIEDTEVDSHNEKLLADEDTAEDTKALDHKHVSNMETTESRHLDDSISPTQANDMRKEDVSDNSEQSDKAAQGNEEIEEPDLTGEEATVKKEETKHGYQKKTDGVVKPEAKNPLNTENK